MKFSFLFLISMVIGLSVFVNAQESENGEPPQISISENIKQQIVRRILVFKFKPAKKLKVINLVKDDINQTWLPEIRNVEFKLLSDEEVEDIDSDIYFFTKADANGKNYGIGFAFGVPNCSYFGDYWNFRIINNKLRLWYAGGMFGGCGGNDTAFKTPGKLNTYPNELEGYKFFDQGKLKGLKLMVSTKEDVKKIFGSDCDRECDYDDKWKIAFNYFGGISKEQTINEKKVRYVPKKELVGTIYSITLTPKQSIPFGKKIFPRTFNESYGFSVGDSFDENGRLSAAGNSYITHYDRYGLKYEVYQSGYAVNAEKTNRKEGDLFFIEYSIPEKIEETTFVEEQ